MDSDIICDVCGKDISDPVRTTGMVCFEFGPHPCYNRESEHLKNQFGVYLPAIYRICAECMLKSFGTKPNKEQDDEKEETGK